MNDLKHSHYEGYREGWTSANDYVEGLYRRIPGGDANVEISDRVLAEGDDADFRQRLDAAIAERWVPLDLARAEGERLFKGEAGAEVGDVLDGPLYGLAPQAEVRAHVQLASYLADLGRLRREASSPASGRPGFERSLK